MAFRKTFMVKMKCDSGFTLIEALVVLSLVSILASLTLFFDMSNYRAESLHNEERLLMSTLERARTNAQNNVHERAHGVALHPNGNATYVSFEGNSLAESELHTREILPSAFTLGPSTPQEIVFAQLSGDVASGGEVVLVDSLRNASTSFFINHEGNIGW